MKTPGVKECIYCASNGPFSTVQHIIPESFLNIELTIRDAVCDGCQKYFGTKVEEFVLSKTLFALPRYQFWQRNKKGKLPVIDMSVPRKSTGKFPSSSLSHDNIRFKNNEDGSREIRLTDTTPNKRHHRESDTISIITTPMALRTMGQFCLKVGLEVMALDFPEEVRDPRLDKARWYARYGVPHGTYWPLYVQNVAGPYVEPHMKFHLGPFENGERWCDFDVVLFKFRFDLLNSAPKEVPDYIMLRPAPDSDRTQ